MQATTAIGPTNFSDLIFFFARKRLRYICYHRCLLWLKGNCDLKSQSERVRFEKKSSSESRIGNSNCGSFLTFMGFSRKLEDTASSELITDALSEIQATLKLVNTMMGVRNKVGNGFIIIGEFCKANQSLSWHHPLLKSYSVRWKSKPRLLEKFGISGWTFVSRSKNAEV